MVLGFGFNFNTFVSLLLMWFLKWDIVAWAVITIFLAITPSGAKK
jgi:hypothetical protein